MGTSRVVRLGEIDVVLSREEGPPVHDADIDAALMARMTREPIRVSEDTVYRVTSIMRKACETA